MTIAHDRAVAGKKAERIFEIASWMTSHSITCLAQMLLSPYWRMQRTSDSSGLIEE